MRIFSLIKIEYINTFLLLGSYLYFKKKTSFKLFFDNQKNTQFYLLKTKPEVCSFKKNLGWLAVELQCFTYKKLAQKLSLDLNWLTWLSMQVFITWGTVALLSTKISLYRYRFVATQNCKWIMIMNSRTVNMQTQKS